MIKTGSEDLDKFLAGYEENSLTTIYGEAGSGKTTLCLLIAIEFALNNKKVLFLDTESNFSTERFEQLLKGRNKECLKNILILKIKNFNLQHTQIKSLEGIKKISLIIVDSITHHFRRLNNKEPELAKGMLAKQLIILKDTSKNNMPVLITSQVYSNMKNGILPVGKEVINKFTKNIIKLEKNPRKIINEATDKSANFEINNEGIKIND
ncbi:AAA family ATPase [Candidatus Woesearchaeota archaeon]|nr:AAA family ATPase [Candidatus Woesearchaeota archaeon]